MSICVKNNGGIGDVIKRIITARYYYPDEEIIIRKAKKSRINNSIKLINCFPNVIIDNNKKGRKLDKPIIIKKIKTKDINSLKSANIQENFLISSLRCSTFGTNIKKGNFLEYRNFDKKTILEMEKFLIQNSNVKVILQHETDIEVNAWLAHNCSYSFHVDSGMPWFYNQFISNGSCLLNWSINLVKDNPLSKNYIDHHNQLKEQGWDLINECCVSWKDEFAKLLDSKGLLKK